MLIYKLLESGLVPDLIVRFGIRRMLEQKLIEESSADVQSEKAKLISFIEELKNSPIAFEVDAANRQHYELPSQFFELVLGPNLKYSCGLWTERDDDLASSEEKMLATYVERAKIQDGQTILDLGCGWGSLSFYLAGLFPKARILAISNSNVQRAYIEERKLDLDIDNLEVITADISNFDTERRFDRIVSVEMFEHMKNYELLLKKVSSWLEDDGFLFVHIFSHIKHAYHYENTDGKDWLTENFFLGGTMPSDDLLLYFQRDVSLVEHYRVSGSHYQKTANAWLRRMDQNRKQIMPILSSTYGASEARKWWVYWRVFFMACAELWGYENGCQWIVSHYLFSPLSSKRVSGDGQTFIRVLNG